MVQNKQSGFNNRVGWKLSGYLINGGSGVLINGGRDGKSKNYVIVVSVKKQI